MVYLSNDFYSTITGMRWNDWFYSPSKKVKRLLFGHIVMILVFDSILYMLITLYLEQVLPGPFGSPQKWYFLFQKSYWTGNKKVDGEFDKIFIYLA